MFNTDRDRLYVLVHDYFKRLLLEWEDDLDKRPGALATPRWVPERRQRGGSRSRPRSRARRHVRGSSRSLEHVKRSMQGKIETVTMQQAHEYMKPFFKMLKTKVSLAVRSTVARQDRNALTERPWHMCVLHGAPVHARRRHGQHGHDQPVHAGARVCQGQRHVLPALDRQRAVAHWRDDGRHPRALGPRKDLFAPSGPYARSWLLERTGSDVGVSPV